MEEVIREFLLAALGVLGGFVIGILVGHRQEKKEHQ